MKASDAEITKLLRSAMEPVPKQELSRDLWPLLQERIRSRQRLWGFRDWAVVAVGIAAGVAFPGALSFVLYAL